MQGDADGKVCSDTKTPAGGPVVALIAHEHLLLVPIVDVDGLHPSADNLLHLELLRSELVTLARSLETAALTHRLVSVQRRSRGDPKDLLHDLLDSRHPARPAHEFDAVQLLSSHGGGLEQTEQTGAHLLELLTSQLLKGCAVHRDVHVHVVHKGVDLPL